MPLKHYTGPRLPGDTGAPPPPPPVPAATRRGPEVQPPGVAPLAVPAPSQQLPRDFQGLLVTIVDAGVAGGLEVTGAGPSLEAAFEDACLKYQAAQPVQPLVWQDGTELDATDRQLLIEALEVYTDLHGTGLIPDHTLRLGRLKGALGEGS